MESEQVLTSHKKKIHAILPARGCFWKCEACSKCYTNKTITDHTSTPHIYNCHHCTLLFVTEIELDTHLKSFHKTTPGLEKNVALIGKSPKKLMTPEQPVTDVAKSSLSIEAVSINTPKLSGNPSKRKDNMTANSSPSKPSSPYCKLDEPYWKCPLCLDLFKTENKLSAHLDKKHKHDCDQCSHTFTTLIAYMRHSVEVHRMEVNSTDICEDCGEVIDKKTMAEHKRRPHLVPCDDCSWSHQNKLTSSLHYINPAELWKHKIKEHYWGNQMNRVNVGNKSGKVKDVAGCLTSRISPIKAIMSYEDELLDEIDVMDLENNGEYGEFDQKCLETSVKNIKGDVLPKQLPRKSEQSSFTTNDGVKRLKTDASNYEEVNHSLELDFNMDETSIQVMQDVKQKLDNYFNKSPKCENIVKVVIQIFKKEPLDENDIKQEYGEMIDVKDEVKIKQEPCDVGLKDAIKGEIKEELGGNFIYNKTKEGNVQESTISFTDDKIKAEIKPILSENHLQLITEGLSESKWAKADDKATNIMKGEPETVVGVSDSEEG